MALGIALLLAGPRDRRGMESKMLLTGTLAGALLALDNALDLDNDLGALSGLAGLRRRAVGDGVAAGEVVLNYAPGRT